MGIWELAGSLEQFLPLFLLITAVMGPVAFALCLRTRLKPRLDARRRLNRHADAKRMVDNAAEIERLEALLRLNSRGKGRVSSSTNSKNGAGLVSSDSSSDSAEEVDACLFQAQLDLRAVDLSAQDLEGDTRYGGDKLTWAEQHMLAEAETEVERGAILAIIRRRRVNASGESESENQLERDSPSPSTKISFGNVHKPKNQ